MRRPAFTFLDTRSNAGWAFGTPDAAAPKLTFAELVQEQQRQRQKSMAAAQGAMRSELALIARRDPAALKHHEYTMRVATGGPAPTQWTPADIARLSDIVKGMWADKMRALSTRNPEQEARRRARGSYEAVLPWWRRIAARAAERVRDLDAKQLADRDALILRRRRR